MVVEVPRWTNAKMEVTAFWFQAEVLELSRLLTPGLACSPFLSSAFQKGAFVAL